MALIQLLVFHTRSLFKSRWKGDLLEAEAEHFNVRVCGPTENSLSSYLQYRPESWLHTMLYGLKRDVLRLANLLLTEVIAMC